MTDGELVKIASQINRHLAKVRQLIERIETSGRDDAAAIVEELWENEIPTAASAEAVVHSYINPKQWVLVDGTYIFHVSSNALKKW